MFLGRLFLVDDKTRLGLVGLHVPIHVDDAVGLYNLALRDHEKGLSTGEKQMFVKAKKILASELMYAKDLDEDGAAEWLDGVLVGSVNGTSNGRKETAKPTKVAARTVKAAPKRATSKPAARKTPAKATPKAAAKAKPKTKARATAR